MVKVGVVGSTGYAGAELVRILAGHKNVELTVLTSRQYANIQFSNVFPSMAGIVHLECEEMSMDNLCEKADVLFLALPHKIPMQIVPNFLKRGKKIIDLSADFRLKNAFTYERYYQPHCAKELLDKAVYGLCEVYKDKIKNTDFIANPGCYPTSVLLPLIPLIKAKMIDVKTIVVDSKSGVSGAGRSLSLTTHFCEVNESLKAYKVTKHRHKPEMEEILSCVVETDIKITFVPHLIPMTRGMYTTIYARLAQKLDFNDIQNCISEYYYNRPFIRICPENIQPDTRNVKGTNFCDIGLAIDDTNNCLVLMSAIDNLVKGAAGQAVQNMNIMLGFDETVGLMNASAPI